MKKVLSGILLPLLLSYLVSSCDKKYHFDGVVLSRHGYPVPNAKVYISLGHGEHKGGGGSINMSTDDEGKFSSNGRFCSNCWAVDITASSDSGEIERQPINQQNQSNIQLILK